MSNRVNPVFDDVLAVMRGQQTEEEKLEEQKVNNYANAMIKKDQRDRLEGK